MTVFKSYFKVLKQNKLFVILYLCILFVFTIFGSTNTNTNLDFSDVKPSIAVITYEENELTDNFINYLDSKSKLSLELKEDEIDDALFYEKVSAVIYIKEGYEKDILNNEDIVLDVKYSTSAYSSFAKMIIENYLQILDISNDLYNESNLIIKNIDNSFIEETEVTINNTVDTNTLSKVGNYFSFANYSILALSIYIIATLLATYNNKNIKKRNMVSSYKYNNILKQLYLANLVSSLILFLLVVLIGRIVVGSTIFSTNGLFMILNCFIFTLVALSIGFLIGTIFKNKSAINGMVNIIALGSSFLCGAFMPLSMLPSAVVKFAKLLPSYYYIRNNDLLSTINNYDFSSMKEVYTNYLVMFIYVIGLILLTIILNKKIKED